MSELEQCQDRICEEFQQKVRDAELNAPMSPPEGWVKEEDDDGI